MKIAIPSPLRLCVGLMAVLGPALALAQTPTPDKGDVAWMLTSTALVLLMSVPAYQWAWSDHDVANGHHRRYTRPRAVASVTAAGFEVLRATYGFAGVFPAFAAERAVRHLQQRFTRSRRTEPADVVDLPAVGPATERLLLGLCRIDQGLLGGRDLPFGSSVFLAAVRR